MAGGASYSYSGGPGGGIEGISYYSKVSPAGTQTSGYLFGIGRDGWGVADSDGVAGGGGGYYGGQTSNTSCQSAGAGGSGYVSGHEYCIAITGEGDTTPKSATYSQLSDSYHYSGKVFTDTELITGNLTMPTWDGSSTMTGNNDEGYAKITALELIESTYPVSNITIDNGTLTENFNPSVYDYYAEVNSDIPDVNITITPTSDDVIVENGLVQKVTTEVGTTVQEIKVIGTDGCEYTYRMHFVRKASAYSYLDGIIVDGTEIADFSPTKTSYTIDLPYYIEEDVLIDAIKARPGQKVTGIGTIDTSHSTTMCAIEVTSEDGEHTTIYNLTLNKTPSTKLKYLDFKGQDFYEVFESDKYEYDFEVTTGVVALNVEAIPYDDQAKVSIKGAGYIKEGRNTVTITVSRDGIADTVYTIYVLKGESLGVIPYDYDYTGDYQIFVAPATAHYKFECWGASGGKSLVNGNPSTNTGLGGYTSGVIKLKEGDTFYIYVGGQGENARLRTSVKGGWNGGGNATWDNNDDESSGGGGGATDIRLVPGTWNDSASQMTRVMVAGAGGGKSYTYNGGPGGGLSGYSYYSVSKPGTQTSGYGLGIGKNGWGTADSDGVAGGGSGYYGGETNNVSYRSSGAGGSSYISGHDGCDAMDENGTHTGQSIHYSGIKFKDTVMIDGAGYEWTDSIGGYVKMEDPTGNYVNGKSGNGYARITLLDLSENNLLKEIQIDKGTLEPELNFDDKDYTINLGPDDTQLTIYGVVDDIKASIEGNGTYDILPGENKIELKVTAESGDERIYTITVNRPASTNAKPINITIDGLIESIINIDEKYGKLDPEEFDPDVHEYSMIVPGRIKKLIFEVEKGHPYQTVTGDGIRMLEGGDNEIIIEVTSEDGNSTETYTYHIERDMSGNCLLESLTVDNTEEEIDFDPEVLEYFVIVPNEIDTLEKLNIVAIPEIKTIVPQIVGRSNLKVGLNDIHILVTADNGEQLVYVLHVYRKMSGNTFLEYLKVLDGETELTLEPTFNKILDTYTVEVPNNISVVNITAKPEVNTTTVTGAGQKTLKTGNNNYVIRAKAQDGSIGEYNVTIIRARSNNNYLSKLECSNGAFDSSFDKEDLSYEITVDSSVKSLNLQIEKEDPTATYQVIGNKNFTVGENTVEIKVTAENGDVRTYTIKVNRLASDNNNLLSLSTSHGTLSPKFDKNTTSYTVEVENEVEIITVYATKEDSSSKITGTGKYALAVGENEINVSVEAENGDEKVYTIIVTRKQSSNANLLRVDNDKNAVVKKKDNSTYTISVQNNVNKISITGVPEKATSTVSGNGEYGLVVGENTIKLKVKAEDGTEKEYNVIVTREKSNNANLSFLFAEEGSISPEFDKNVTSYAIKVASDVEKLTLDVKTEDKDASYIVIGNSNLKYGANKVTIRVTASDEKTEKYYYLNVYKQAENIVSNDLIALIVDKGELKPAFDAETTVYDVELPYSATNITVDAIALDANAIVEGTGTYELETGVNVIAVNVTSSDGIQKSYQVRVTRAKSNDARLSMLSVEGHPLSPTFNSNTFTYSIETTLTNLDIIAIPMEEEATYEIIGNKDLQKGLNNVTIRVTAPDGVSKKDYTIKVTRTKSNNNNLASLRVVGYDISPEFSKTNLVYTTYVEKDVNSVMIEATADDENATISGIGSFSLSTGRNVTEVVVTSESGKVKKYTVIIYREASNNNYLSSLAVSEGTLDPEFVKTHNDYEVEVDYEVDSIILTGSVEDSTASVTGLGKYNLQVGENNIPVKVVSESGIENIYTVKVTRKEAVSAKLKKLTANPYSLDPKFNMDINEYNITVDNEITSLNLGIETLDPHATYVVTGNEDFEIGMNTVTIEVTSSDGVTKETYILNVTRQLSSNNYLDYILVSEGKLTPSYVKTTIYYEVNVANDITSITVDAEASDEKATVTGPGTYSLEVGENPIKIEVTSATGIKRTYTVNVIRAKNSNNYLKDLVIKSGSTTLTLDPIFNKETLEYNVTATEGTTRAQILATAESELATVTGTGYVTVVAGENKYDIKVIAEDGSTRTYTINLTRPKSSDNNLTELIPSVGTLSPSFEYGRTDYTLTLGNLDSLLSFEVNTSNRFATVTGNEEQEVPDGESTRTITVTAEDGTTKTYTVTVIRNRTDDARLKSLAVKSFELDQEFDEDLFEYTMTVPNDKFELTENEIVAIPKYEASDVYLTPIIQLSVLDLNTYTIVVTAPDGYTTQKYTIKVTREKSSDSSLMKLAVSGYEIEDEFESSVKAYTVAFPKAKTKLEAADVIAIPTDQYATVVKMDEVDLNKGQKRYEVTVTSHDETSTSVYTIDVETEKGGNNYLESLTVTPGKLSPSFDTNIINYDVHVKKNQEFVTVEAIPEDPTSIVVSGTGEIELEGDETQILVLIQAENEKLRGYVIMVYRDLDVFSTIKGKITTENVDSIYKATVTLYQDGEAIDQMETEDDGTYHFDVEEGIYDIEVQKDGYLKYTVQNIIIEENEEDEIDLLEKKLIAGDLNQDGEIEISDLIYINDNIHNYVDSICDLNEDGVVDSADRNILRANFGKQEETIEWAMPIKAISFMMYNTVGVDAHIDPTNIDMITQETTRKGNKSEEENEDEDEDDNDDTVGVDAHIDPNQNNTDNNDNDIVGVDAHIDPNQNNTDNNDNGNVGVDAHINPNP